MSLGLTRAKNVLYNMYRTGKLSEAEYQEYLNYDLTKDFKPSESAEKSSHDYLYFTAFEEAQKAMYDYLIQRDNARAEK